jgi:arylsulfatase A-like enzyme/putative intracellular protease/amidase
MSEQRPDVIILMTDEERAAPPYESDDTAAWRRRVLANEAWFNRNAINFRRHYTGSLACVPSRPTLFTGQYPEVHGVTQTNGLGKSDSDSRMRWLREGEVPTLGHWFRAAGYDTHYDGKWHISHADLHDEEGNVLATNDGDGVPDPDAVQKYIDADCLGPCGFSGWVGPEPHGAGLANSGLRRDPLIAERVVNWLENRYARRRAGDAEALKPFLLVASFVNPHDIVLWPAWLRRNPLKNSPMQLPTIDESPTDNEDLASKPAAQIAYRESYASGYGPVPLVNNAYKRNAAEYRQFYYRLHAEVDGPLEQVRRAITDDGSEEAVIVRTSDHGELLGSHGGLHQKWFQLYDEATRVPFSVARIGANATTGAFVDEAPTSHVDIIPTLLAAAGIDESEIAATLAESFTEVHALPGTNLMPVIDDVHTADRDRAVYMMTNDNMLEGDTGASGVARQMGRIDKPPMPLRIQVPAHVAANFEGIVVRVDEADASGGAGALWKLVRTFDDPATWTEPGVRHLASTAPGGDRYRSEPLPDQWELYNLESDPIEGINRWNHADSVEVFAHIRSVLKLERARAVPERNNPWPYASRTPHGGPVAKSVRPPVKVLRKVLGKVGMHPTDPDVKSFSLPGRRALVVATNAAVLDIGKPTGVFASEMTVPYYAFLDAGLDVDVASPLGGVIPVDPQSMRPPIRTPEDDRFLGDDVLRSKVMDSLAIGDLDMADYDIVFLAGGWGAAFDFGFSEILGEKMTEANAADKLIGGICHGPLGLINATGKDGEPLVKGRKVSAVTDKQVQELGISSTPHHPETELRKVGADFESQTRFRDPLANHWVVDGNLVTGQNQNAGPMVSRELLDLLEAKG